MALSFSENDRKRRNAAIDKHFRAKMPDGVRSLVALATEDLYNGPIDSESLDEGETWPGFLTAVATIAQWWADEREAMIWDPETEQLCGTVREWERWADQEDRDNPDCPIDRSMFVEIDEREAARIVFGPELAGHVS